ncbi:flavin-containing monooxygenase [Maricaulis sp.]|uniref:flavin-containing monooxygenase n=1 Tax=Maricaulis sp. TaxID=1486257 RepID=UPI003A8DC92A
MSDEHFDVLIVGAGISGIAAAYHLQTRSPDRSYAILEARDAIGGTWDLFRYPGIRSDSDMYTFGFAFRPWTDGKVFADGPAIREYVSDTAQRNGIEDKIRFGTRVAHADWDSEAARWTVRTERGEDGQRRSFTCNFLMMCSGYYRYEHGYMPDFAGMEDFSGAIIHPQLWPEDVDYTGKKVVIIGSGATAVTLVPAMAEKAAHVTMLQRSPTYIAARPSRDGFADFMRKILPEKIAYSVTRAKNVLLNIYIFQFSQSYPALVKREVMKAIRIRLGPDFDVKKHFSPSYNPWDQRFCLAPDGDFFDVLADGSASIVTDQIECFTRTGIKLKSGDEIEADLIIPATGLEMQLLGGMTLSVDGTMVRAAEKVTYRGMMLSDVPNFAIAFGYTNASWTLKIDLTCERVCRLLNHMAARGYDYCVPTPPADLETVPMLDFSSGYVQRAMAHLPQQGVKSPWRTYQNYVQDMLTIRFGKLEDGAMKFGRVGDTAQQAPALEAAE